MLSFTSSVSSTSTRNALAIWLWPRLVWSIAFLLCFSPSLPSLALHYRASWLLCRLPSSDPVVPRHQLLARCRLSSPHCPSRALSLPPYPFLCTHLRLCSSVFPILHHLLQLSVLIQLWHFFLLLVTSVNKVGRYPCRIGGGGSIDWLSNARR